MDDLNSSFQLVRTVTKFEKDNRHQLYVFIKKKKTTVNSAKCSTKSLTVHLHNVSTVLLDHFITGMTRALSCKCSDRAGDNQSRSRILLWFWFGWKLCEDSDQNSPLGAPEYTHKCVWRSNPFLAVEGMELIGTVSLDLRKHWLEMVLRWNVSKRDQYIPLPDTNLSCVNYH